MPTHRERSCHRRVEIAVCFDPPIHHLPRLPRTGVYCTRDNCDCWAQWDNRAENLEHRRHASWGEGGMEVPNVARADREEVWRREGQGHSDHGAQVHRVR